MESKSKTNNKGQSTVEFIMTFFTALSFIFLFFKTATNYTDGYMVHHATYMASRAYMAFDDDRDNLEEGDANAFKHAQGVFKQYLLEEMFSMVSSTDLKENGPTTTSNHAYVGLHVKYTQKFSLGAIAPNQEVQYISESFLGREPTKSETKEQVCKAFQRVGLSAGGCNRHVTIDDNGG